MVQPGLTFAQIVATVEDRLREAERNDKTGQTRNDDEPTSPCIRGTIQFAVTQEGILYQRHSKVQTIRLLFFPHGVIAHPQSLGLS